MLQDVVSHHPAHDDHNSDGRRVHLGPEWDLKDSSFDIFIGMTN